MKALVFDGGIRLADLPIPEREKGQALVRVDLAGICNTDVEVTRGYLAYRGIMGHEFVGKVEDADDAGLIGKRVVGEINISCGECRMCRSGSPRHCERVRAMGINGWQGCFADYLVLPESNLHVVPDSVADRHAVFAEPLAAGLEVLEQVHIRPVDMVAVIGDGKLGLLTAQAIYVCGHRVVVLGKHLEKLAIARNMGIGVAFASDFAGQVDIAVDCTGNPSGMQTAMAIVRNEIACVGSRCGPFPPALRLLEAGAVSVEPLIDAVFRADEAVRAFERACARGSLKILVDFADRR